MDATLLGQKPSLHLDFYKKKMYAFLMWFEIWIREKNS